ncbi:dihydrolipoyl dehydrogenase [Nocardioides kongjuensis]|uniref:Dihydrolipoyl dehydrogenase n=1 Tax=Nocardioides kongjuensis TaxID=349522 RepID=A0A852R3J3_9ACTN|nr:dihydrolipoyl dehydrogenase [Nocardioides kongjuensis]NYD29353.1 dihydrolipoamide dehydrogenase [Nocardioides kongjuensis]
MSKVDLVILGAGSAGYACALRASQLGLSVVLVDRDKLGGTCLHRGCIPTKALLHAAEVADHVREAPALGIGAELTGIDMDKIHRYRTGVIDRLHRGLTGLVGSRGIEVVAGEGQFVGPNTVQVGERTIEADAVVLATGARPRRIQGIETDGTHILTSDDALTLGRVPSSAIVLGGGVIGCEFASLWRSLGAAVTVVEGLPRLVASEDEDISRQLDRALKRRGIKIQTGQKVTGVERTTDGVRVAFEGDSTAEAEVLLVAVGREAVIDGFEEAGIAVDRGVVVTDERLRTNLTNVYAVGDLVAGPQLAHRGYAHGIFVAEEIAGLAPRPVNDELVPKVTFTQPEIASVGLTEAVARERYGDQITCATQDLAGNGRSLILGSGGMVKVVRRHEHEVLGVHIVAARAGEMIGEGQLLTSLGIAPEAVAPFVHAHPTQHEALGEALQALAGKALHGH